MRFGAWRLGFGICRKGSAALFRCILFLLFCTLLLAGCAAKQVALPSYEGVPVEEALAELRTISSMEAILSVQYERGDTFMSGDAALSLTGSRLSLKVFYLGFLAAELTEENGVVRSKPHLDRQKSTMLVEGLKNSFLWWNISGYTLEEAGEQYVIMSPERELVLDRKTLLPTRQVLHLDNGERITIAYSSPARADLGRTEEEGQQAPHFRVFSSGLWYPSEMTIGFRNQSARVRVTSLTVLN